MKKLLAFAAIAEAATGLALIVVPSLVGWVLLGTELTGVAIPIARVTGIALVGLGVACWLNWTALCGMLTYGTLVTLYLTPGYPRRMGWASVMAGCGIARRPNAAASPRVAQRSYTDQLGSHVSGG